MVHRQVPEITTKNSLSPIKLISQDNECLKCGYRHKATGIQFLAGIINGSTHYN